MRKPRVALFVLASALPLATAQAAHPGDIKRELVLVALNTSAAATPASSSRCRTARSLRLSLRSSARWTDPAARRGGGMTSADQNKALVRRFYEEIDKGNIAICDELVAENYLDHNPPPFPTSLAGRERLKQEFRIFLTATPGYHVIEDQIAEGDKVVTRLTSYGRHDGDLPGAPRTGNEMKMTSITIHRVANGKLAEKWSEKDMIGLLTQIGVMPPMHAKA
jgi:predicted ester cyclase